MHTGIQYIIIKIRKNVRKIIFHFLKKYSLFLLKIEILSRINAHICKNWTYYLKRWARRSDFRLHMYIPFHIFHR